MDYELLLKEEIVHLLKKEIADNIALGKELDSANKRIMQQCKQWNDFQLANNVGSINAWISIEKFFKTNKEIQPYLKEVSEELHKDGWYGLTTHMISTIKILLEKAIQYDNE